MKTFKVLLISFLFLACGNLFSQPLIVIHLTGGYSLPAADLRGNVLDSLTSNFHTKIGFNIGGDAALGLGRLRSVRLLFSLQYHGFSNKSDNLVSSSVGYEKFSFNDMQIGAGVELALSPKSTIDPFVSAEIISSFISGSRTFDKPDAGHVNADMNSATRYGLAIGAGLDFMLFKASGIGGVIGAKYHFANLLGKSEGNNIFINTNYDLDDQTNGKNISFMSFYAGLTFYIGEPVKHYKK